jgi:hypothetical protein
LNAENSSLDFKKVPAYPQMTYQLNPIGPIPLKQLNNQGKPSKKSSSNHVLRDITDTSFFPVLTANCPKGNNEKTLKLQGSIKEP